MNELRVFNNEEFGKIRSTIINNEPWFVGKDIAEILGYSNTRKAIIDHVDDEDKKDGVTIRDSIGREQKPALINESGLYSLILSSKLPNAKKFKKWVTSEVLPNIRKNGMYATDELLDNPDLLIATAKRLKEEKEKRIALEKINLINRPKVIFADSVATSDQTILIGDLAKLIKQNGVDMGQNRLFEWLRNNGFLIRKKGESYNMPTQVSMEMGLFKIKESTNNNPDGSIRITKTPKVTGKGQQYFINKFLAAKKMM